MSKFHIQFTKLFAFLAILIAALSSCSSSKKISNDPIIKTEKSSTSKPPSGKVNPKAKVFIQPVNIDREAFVKYAKTLLGIKYVYGSTNPSKGLDCSGFVFNVFQHFNVSCPRVTKDYMNEGREVTKSQARIGDIILFTGSDNSSGIVGHMGIIVKEGTVPQFIHSASGKNIGVIINDLKGYYETHFVKIISVLK